jgi:CRP-like cAMP-binding protein
VRDRLSAVPLFADLEDEQLDQLAAKTSEFEAPAGQALIERGRPGAGLFVLEEGEASVEAPEGTRTLGPGDVFGERSLFGDGARTARVRALTDVRCLAIARPEMEQLMADHPAIGERLRQLSD